MNTNKLKGIMAEHNATQKDLAKILGISESTAYRKLKRGSFTTEEAQKLIDCWMIKDPIDIFLR